MYGKKKKRLSLLVAMIVLLSFSGIALAGTAIGSWTSTTCMNGFTASNTLTKAAGQEWNSYYPKANSVRYADDGYSEERWMISWIKSPVSNERLSDKCVSCSFEDDNATIYEQADQFNTVKVWIGNYECPGTANMRSNGEFWASYGPDW